MTPQSSKGWAEKFDEKFRPGDFIPEPFKSAGWEILEVQKDFIRSLLADHDREICEKLEKIKKEWESKPPKPGLENRNDGVEMYHCGYFDAIDDAIEMIKGEK